jgi:hypothetical protein
MKEITYLKGDIRLHNDEVFVMDAARENQRTLQIQLRQKVGLFWRGYNEILFSSDSSGTFNLYSVNVNGSNLKRLTATETPLRDGRISVHPVNG